MSENLEGLNKRRIPCLLAFLAPFRIVKNDDLVPWAANIEQIHSQSWDYIALHEMVGGLDVGLPAPYHMAISLDGAVAIPPLPHLRSQIESVAFLNECFAALLIGGVYCEAITPDGLSTGCIIDWKYIRMWSAGPSATCTFHQHIRMKQASSLDAIRLLGPREVEFTTLQSAIKTGQSVLQKLPKVRGELLLKGVTGIARRDWGAALINLWIVSEQLISELWDRHVLGPTLTSDASSARKNQLLDTRTWTAAARIEMLFQIGILSHEILKALTVARRARNDLAHQGKRPTESEAQQAYNCVLGLLLNGLDGAKVPLMDLSLADHSISDPFLPRPMLQPDYWMEIPKLPGERELEALEARSRSKKN